MESTEVTYQDFEAAIKAKAVGEGKWIPGFLPPSATGIRERHNLDTNEVWLSFQFNQSDPNPMMASCDRVTEDKVTYPRKSPSDWWPRILTQLPGGVQTSDQVYEYYQCKDGGTMAINAKRSEAFYWELG